MLLIVCLAIWGITIYLLADSNGSHVGIEDCVDDPWFTED